MALLADVNGELVRAEPGTRGTCRACGHTMIPKCGQIVIWHWAHDTRDDCDPWSEPETRWHLEWKLDFLNAGCRIEVPIVRHDERHRADVVLPNGRVLELQGDYQDWETIERREQFYGSMAWLYRAHWWNDERIYRFGDNAFRWKHPGKSMLAHRRPIFWDVTETYNDGGDDEQLILSIVGLRQNWREKVYGQIRLFEFPDEWVERIVDTIGGVVHWHQPGPNTPVCELCGTSCYRTVAGRAIHPCCATNERHYPGTPCPSCAASRTAAREFQRREDERLTNS